MKLTSIAVLAVFLTSAAHGAEKPSQAFLKKPIEGSFAEIRMGQLAQQKGHSDNLKKFNQTLADDHSAAN
jgi:putative membrane protein